MKKIISVALLLLLASACKKSSQSPAGYYGTWELRHYSGTIAGVNETLPAGNGSTLRLNHDSSYALFVDFKQVAVGTFSIKPASIDFGGTTYDGIFFSGIPFGEFITLKADSLTIGQTFADGEISVYVRQK